MNQAEIFGDIESLIPVQLWAKYKHLSFGEMAEIPELFDYADALRRAEAEWFRAETE